MEDEDIRHLEVGKTFMFAGIKYEVEELDKRYKKNVCANCDMKTFCRLGIAKIGVNIPLCSIRKDKKHVVFRMLDKYIIRGEE